MNGRLSKNRFMSLLTFVSMLVYVSNASGQQNLVENPTFTGGHAPWETADPNLGWWDSLDAGGDDESGSGEVSDDNVGNGGVRILLSQCIEIPGGETYDYGGQILVPFNQPEGTAGHIGVEAFETADCSGNIGVRDFVGSSVQERWIVVKDSFETPASARSLQVSIGVEKEVDEMNFAQINADNVFVSPAGESLLPINETLAGIWYDSNTTGQGKVVDISAQINLFFAGWYTWTLTPGVLDWMILQGGFRGDQAEVDIIRVSGGVFNDPTPVETDPVGDAIFRARTCTEAELLFRFDGEQDYTLIDLTRLGPAPLDCVD